MSFSNSKLVTKTKISPNRTQNRNHVIDTITIHCYVGQVSLDRALDGFANPARQASCNYVISYDGKIGLCVEEKDRSWCTGGKDKNGNPIKVNGITGSQNDYRAVTIEVASDTTAPYAVTDAAYNALIELCADICKRNNIKKLIWKADKSLVGKIDQQNMTAHRWFANKACPGDFLYNRFGKIADAVNKKLNIVDPPKKTVPDAYYRTSVVKGKWNSQVKNYNTKNADGYAGVFGKPIDKIAISIAGGVRYRVAPIGKGYLPWVTGYDIKDSDDGYAGLDDVAFDRIQIDAKKCKAVYRVHTTDGKWQSWVTGYNTLTSSGYAGVKGKKIDAIQIYTK